MHRTHTAYADTHVLQNLCEDSALRSGLTKGGLFAVFVSLYINLETLKRNILRRLFPLLG